jgi:diacylglycerol kinase (ATP)
MSSPRVSLRERLARARGNGAGTTGGLLPGHGRRRISTVESFNYAVEGIIHVLRTHRNLRIHFAAALAVLVLALVLGVDRIQLVGLFLAITFVLVAEMINSAIEAAIDVATSSFDPLAKLAKDIAAGAVLIASINALAVGYLVFSSKVSESSLNFLDRLRDAPAKLTIIALVIVTFLVIMTKALTGRGTPLRGGLPSGHAALAFAAWMAVSIMLGPSEHRFLVSVIMFGVAVLVAQSRIETGIHSTLEVVYGGLLGAAVSLVVFQLFF